MGLKCAQFEAFILILISLLDRTEPKNYTIKRFERSLPLLFTNNSVTTFICGFGVPVHNLNPELVTMGIVLKSQQFLPTTFKSLSKLSSHRIERQTPKEYKNREYFNSHKNISNSIRGQDNKYRTIFYKALEELSESLGQNGHDCVLKMICEATTIPFHYKNGVLGELIYILLTPSTSIDTYKSSKDFDYVNAEKLGKSGVSCEKLFGNCNKSILQSVTNIFD